ncbi:MAG TPA: hypothetical protein VML75_24710 [Kofleriaceae bacterium]|nr:hypothetical protein [Kofleriaceae bacterium]
MADSGGNDRNRDPRVQVLDRGARAELEQASEPPVVARLVIEIRSDGTRTIARGALEDVELGQTVAVEAKGDSPLQLALALARSMFKVPSLARSAARAFLPGRPGRRDRKKP